MGEFHVFLSNQNDTPARVDPSTVDEFTRNLLGRSDLSRALSEVMQDGRELENARNHLAAATAFRFVADNSEDRDQRHEANRQRAVACVKELQAGTENRDLAYKQIVEMFWRYVFRICVRNTGTVDVEDVMQDIFLTAYSKIGTRDAERFSGWLGAIACNASIDTHRKATLPTIPLSDHFDNTLADHRLTESSEESSDEFFETEVQPVLSAEDYHVAWQYYREGATFKQIAKELDKFEGQVKHQFRRVRNELRDHLDEPGG